MTSRNGSLDLLRASAIVMVVNCHAITAFGQSHSTLPISRVFQLGGHGVDLFFVLSGWLLGKQLCEEIRDRGTVDVRRFWFRRWMRTLPAYYAVLFLTFVQVLAQGKTAIDYYMLGFLQNYQSSIPYFGVSWSLCVEEHFYLLVAPILWFLAGRRPRAWFFIGVLFVLPGLARQFGWYGNLHQTHVRYDECAAGVALAAIHVFAPGAWRWLCRCLPLALLLSVGVVCLDVLGRLNPGGAWASDSGPMVWALVSASFVLLANSSEFWSRRFQVPGSRFVAERAYSLYLLHVEAIVLANRLAIQNPAVYLAVVWLTALIGSELLYRLVERPGMLAREWFRQSRSLARHQPVAAPDHVAVPPSEATSGATVALGS